MQEKLSRFLHLDDEIRSICEVLDTADAQISLFRFVERDRHVIEALLAIGIERLAKLTYGLMSESLGRRWPGADIRKFSHRITEAHAACERLVRDQMGRATNRGVTEAALRHVTEDSLLVPLLVDLEEYAFGGRYYNLNQLEGQGESSERDEFWERLNDAATGGVAESEYATSQQYTDAWEACRADLLRKTVLRIRALYLQAWIQGVCGAEAKQYGFGLKGVTPLLVDDI